MTDVCAHVTWKTLDLSGISQGAPSVVSFATGMLSTALLVSSGA